MPAIPKKTAKEKAKTLKTLKERQKGKFRVSIRMTADTAAQELGMDTRSLTKKMRALGIEAGPDNKFSIAQACTAKYGSRELEQTRNFREQADARALDNEVSRNNLVPIRLVIAYLSNVGISIRQYVQISERMDPETRESILADLAEYFLDDAKIRKELFK